ncbi:MAG: aldehyde dehydrogenase (NADP(+)) [Planctomycetota bacterium]|nr:aldehyde dehydrogenase (NADP(+)) [Planctomycetota bacterium]MDA1178710.1 aldehyde dehydrogenase (NADP(+)) [Planctomycetota bacterium]
MSQPVLIDGQWRPSKSSGTFRAYRPASGDMLPAEFPVSTWEDCDAMLTAANNAFAEILELPAEHLAKFLEKYAKAIEANKTILVDIAHEETGLPKSPRLAEVELPRTTMQLRLAAQAAREETWRQAVIDSKAGLRSCYAPIGPVAVFGPNNFPFAFGSISGGDFAAAIAAGNPVIAKANSSHPETTQRLAELADEALRHAELPAATVQMIYRTAHEDGRRLVSDSRLGATGYTGSRSAGLDLKAAADAHGTPIYLELSSVNPVVILDGVLKDRLDEVVNEFVTSGLMGTGQFCTNPGLLLLIRGERTERFVQAVVEKYRQAPVGTLLSQGVARTLSESISLLQSAGAKLLAGTEPVARAGFCHANTVMRVSGKEFLAKPQVLQTEAFGNAVLIVVADDLAQSVKVLQHLEGNLTGSIYSDRDGADDVAYDKLVRVLRTKVGRLLDDRMPTGVAVSPAMNHGGPYPATGHPGFTAVGIPAAMTRFAVLQCYDNVRPYRLPTYLQDENPNGRMWRCIDGDWTLGNVE